MCIMRNLSYQVHREVPGADKFREPTADQQPGGGGAHKKKKDDSGCFGGKKAKGKSAARKITELNCNVQLIGVVLCCDAFKNNAR